MLRNEWEHVQVGEVGVALVGVEDPGVGWTQRDSEHEELERLARLVPVEVPSVLLAHRPSWFSHAARLGFDVMLSGHTHGGQVSLPLAPNHEEDS